VTRVLVTGGAGFIGSHVAEALMSRGDEAVVLDNLASGSRDNVPEGCDFVSTDISDALETAAEVMRLRPEVVVHLAAQTNVELSVAQPSRDASVNIMGTLAVLDAVAQSRCRKVIFASSSTVYGDPARQPVLESDPVQPISPYGVAKAAAEQYIRIIARERRLQYTILRFGNVFGPRDSLGSGHAVTAFVDALLSGRTPTIEWDGEQTKDYVYVGDVADAVVAALERGHNETFNIASEVGVSVNELYQRVCAVTGIHTVPGHRGRRSGDVRTFVMSCSKARRLLGWRAHTPFLKALTLTVESMARAHEHTDSKVPSAAG
jgi:UDP-glucose 4-epimerase